MSEWGPTRCGLSVVESSIIIFLYLTLFISIHSATTSKTHLQESHTVIDISSPFIGLPLEFAERTPFQILVAPPLLTLICPTSSLHNTQNPSHHGQRNDGSYRERHTNGMAVATQHRICPASQSPPYLYHWHHWAQDQFCRQDQHATKSWSQCRPHEFLPWLVRVPSVSR